MIVTVRDKQVLLAVHEHGYLTSEHIKRLLFPSVARQIPSRRLRLLWVHGFLDRTYLPVVLDGTKRLLPPGLIEGGCVDLVQAA